MSLHLYEQSQNNLNCLVMMKQSDAFLFRFFNYFSFPQLSGGESKTAAEIRLLECQGGGSEEEELVREGKRGAYGG